MKKKKFLRAIIPGVILASLIFASIGQAAILKLSGELPDFGDVDSFQISPDGQTAVYRADQQIDEWSGLYRVPMEGGPWVRISPFVFASTIDVRDYQFSPDGSRVVFLIYSEDTYYRVTEVFSVPTHGAESDAVRLNKTLASGREVASFAISPDGSRVVYLADQDTEDVFELYSVPVEGPAEAGVKLHPALPAGASVARYAISPDSSRVVYVVDHGSGLLELNSISIDGRIDSWVTLRGGVQDFAISPDSSRVIYTVQHSSTTDLYSAPVAGPGSAEVKLSGSPDREELLHVQNFAISPDGERVVYKLLAIEVFGESSVELYSVPVDGSDSPGTRLAGPLDVGRDILDFLISPDSHWVVYRADQDVNEVFELYGVPVNGPAGSRVKLNQTLTSGGDVDNPFGSPFYQISPDSSRVVYLADQQADNRFELYSVPAGGPAGDGIRLNEALPADGNVHWFYITPDNQHVVYLAEQDNAGTTELYRAGTRGPAEFATKINGPLVEGGNVFGFVVSADSKQIGYIAAQERREVHELYATEKERTYYVYLPMVMIHR